MFDENQLVSESEDTHTHTHTELNKVNKDELWVKL
jgi:hypothetical protein